MIWTSIKAKLFLGIGLLVAALLATVKILTKRNSRLSRKVETAEARIHHAAVVSQEKEKNKAEFVSRSREIAKEIEEKGYTKELSEKDEDW